MNVVAWMYKSLRLVLLRFSGAGTLSCGGSLFGPPRCGQPFAGVLCKAAGGCSTLGWLQSKWILKVADKIWHSQESYGGTTEYVYLCISISYIVYSWAFGWGVAICKFVCIRCCYVFISLGLLWKNVWEAQVVTWLQLSWRGTTCLFHQTTILPWVPIIYRMSLFQEPFWAKHNRLLQI